MLEWLTEMLVQTCACLLGFACGMLWMRENYITKIQRLNAEIETLRTFQQINADIEHMSRHYHV